MSTEARVLDRARLASIREFAASVAREHVSVDILVNNAGVAGGPRRLTVDGFEMHLQVNHLGHFALTGLLWPLLRERPGARVVTVSSEVASSGKVDFDDLNAERSYSFVKAYAQSKLANLLFARELPAPFSGTVIDLQISAALSNGGTIPVVVNGASCQAPASKGGGNVP